MIVKLISGEKGKIHSSIFTVLKKMWMSCKRMYSRMFKYKDAFLIQDVRSKYEVGKLSQTRVIKGRICKNNIKGLYRFLQVPECISPDHTHLVHLQFPASLLYEFEVHGCHFNSKNRSCSPGGKFIGNTAST